MTTDVRALLHETAAMPSREPDLAVAQAVARTRRRRRRGLVGAFAAIVLAVGTLGVVRIADDGGSSARVAIGPRQASDVPEGWTPVELDSGITFAMPPGWNFYDFGNTPVAERRIAIGTARPADDSVVVVCDAAAGQLPSEPGTWLSLWEYPAAVGSEVPGPAGDILGVADRPADFRTGSLVGASCPVSGDLGATFELGAFRDAGRVFAVRVVTAYPAGGSPDFEQAHEILNTLRISPLVASTTTLPTPATSGTPTTTTAPAFVPTSADEQQIRDLFVSWQRTHTDDEIRAIVDDADSLLDVIHQGMAQHSEADLAKYSGLVDSVQLTDSAHAVVDYTLLWNGQPQFGQRSGAAVKIEGVWKVSRDTECSLLTLGGITCPPRSNA